VRGTAIYFWTRSGENSEIPHLCARAADRFFTPRTRSGAGCFPAPIYRSLERVAVKDPWFEVYKIHPGRLFFSDEQVSGRRYYRSGSRVSRLFRFLARRVFDSQLIKKEAEDIGLLFNIFVEPCQSRARHWR
jgi:hypothetical protein